MTELMHQTGSWGCIRTRLVRIRRLADDLMMSLDPLTEGGRGYPLLFQTGESWHDQPLHDRQHPHDLFDELSISFSQKFDSDLSVYFYFGYPGEPALRPPTGLHTLGWHDQIPWV